MDVPADDRVDAALACGLRNRSSKLPMYCTAVFALFLRYADSDQWGRPN